MKRAASFHVFALLVLASAQGLLVGADVVVRGRVVALSGQPSVTNQPLVFLTDDGQRLNLAGDEYSTSQLSDTRLKDRHWELRGTAKADGAFDVLRLFTIKDDELFRVTYFCVICNIRSHNAGPCMCCQEETEIEELPVEEP
ncbi:MAG: hypothetical protein O2968_23245 [Acidobacteria bacterium]|nr:hypothetical protein [Acidobacteriota bacterium]